MASSASINFYTTSTGEITQLLTNPDICNDESVELEITFTGIPPFNFSITDGKGNSWDNINVSSVELAGDNPYTYSYAIPVNPTWLEDEDPTVYSYAITYISDASGCDEGVILGEPEQVQVHSSPTIEVFSNNPVCENSSITLYASGGSYYEWSGPNGFSSTEELPILGYASLDDGGTYSVIVTNEYGCSASGSVNVEIIENNSITGDLDDTFNPNTGSNEWILSAATQSDGKILVGGHFTNFHGFANGHIARLNSDGSIDKSFEPCSGPNDDVLAIAFQSDGSTIIGGRFTTYSLVPVGMITRINSDGSLDPSFNISSTGANGLVRQIIILPDDKILIAGEFTTYNNVPRNRIARLNPDGTLDETFDPGDGADHRIWGMDIQDDGKILIVGVFSSYDNIVRNNVARLHPNGTLDTLSLIHI